MIRGVGLRDAIAVNVITMIGIGPLVTIPLVIASLHGSTAMWGWVIGAIVALCDGLVWAELSSRFPGSGGTYVYLREAFGRDRWGRLFAFLFNFQFIFYAPLLLATGYIGFANYAAYYWPPLGTSHFAADALKALLGVLTVALLYRRITSVAKIGNMLFAAAVLTLAVVIFAALPHVSVSQAMSTDMPASFTRGFFLAVGAALFITLYDYVGYADAALIGDEVVAPNRTIPLAILFSILIVAALYLLLQFSILGVLPWKQILGMSADAQQYVGTLVVLHAWGAPLARIFTALVLITAFASLYGNLLGFARVPFAAARDGVFFPIFRHLDARGAFPDVALIVIGLGSIVASFFTLDFVIALLTAEIVLVQAVAQIAAVFILRAKHEAPPFRMWLFPLPALVALVGWLFAYASTGLLAIELSIAATVIGVFAFFLLARAQRTWPFVAALLLAVLVTSTGARADYGHSAVIQQAGYPIFTVDRKPFFVYGAAFFYERLPEDRWRASLQAYKTLGINTIDLYVIWNWHELSDGDFDFTGRTSARRDLRKLLQMIHDLGFKTIVRPGPVIRNEWRNGGYPDWLLRRPEYNMPLSDVLEGRYPATATLQNVHSDDAAAEWMNNSTHMRYATRWLHRVLDEIRPWSSDVIAIALDDDQGAYIDNQTFPAPHFQAYIRYLDSVVHDAAGPRVPTFINTYQMRVPASSPVWAWGNWYQSDAYSIGEHDRAQLEFSTALLQTQAAYPVMISEFQAGWLQGADEGAPRPADPTNTLLALGTLLQMGAHGIVNFPVQDSLYPPGWEAPWANAYYGWDAAYTPLPSSQTRSLPTAQFGQIVARYGSYLAQTHPISNVALEWPEASTPQASEQNAAQAIAALQRCRQSGSHCDMIDPVAATPQQRLRYRRIVPLANATFDATSGSPDCVELAANIGRFGFRACTDYTRRTLSVKPHNLDVPGAHRPVIPVASTVIAPDIVASLTKAHGGVYEADVFGTGYNDVVFDNGLVRLIVSPAAGARSFVFEDDRTHQNVFSTVGAFRDVPLPLATASPRDYIGKYTHPIAAGTFNRPYITTLKGATASFAFDEATAHFKKTIALVPNTRAFTVQSENANSPALFMSGLTTENLASMPACCFLIIGSDARPFRLDEKFAADGAAGLYDRQSHQLIWVSNLNGDIATRRATVIITAKTSGTATALTFGYEYIPTLAKAAAYVRSLKGR